MLSLERVFLHRLLILFFFFFNDTATTEIYTLSLHDALPIYAGDHRGSGEIVLEAEAALRVQGFRSEEHTSELQSRFDLVCRLLLEKKKQDMITNPEHHHDAAATDDGLAAQAVIQLASTFQHI